MKKSRILIVMLVLCAFAVGIWQSNLNNNENASSKIVRSTRQTNTQKSDNKNHLDTNANRFYRDVKAVDYSGLKFTPWDVKATSANVVNQGTKPYTIMVYMNGSDLESESGAATDDLIEMLESGVSSVNANIILFTGGTNRWQNDVIPENECVIWEILDGTINEITGVGQVNMGNAGTLASFIDFSIKNFPAEKYGLVLWDHGGGSIAGYGHDENFNNSNLTLLDLNYAFEKSKLANQKIEFLGFDSCLMATIEMSVVASEYFNYLIASEDLEPGEGWDYSFLEVLNLNPSMDGAMLGMSIVDYFIDFYGMSSDENLTMSVIDLANINRVMEAMGDLMDMCSEDLLRDRVSSFKTFAKKRSNTKTFGLGSPRDNESDMVDIGDMTIKLSDLFPNETANVLNTLKTSVLYNRHNSDIDLKGLSTYYIFGGKDNAEESLDIYESLYMDGYYTRYLFNFFDILNNNGIVTEKRRTRSSGLQNGDNTAFAADDLTCTDITIWRPAEDKQGYYLMVGIQSDVNTDSDEKMATYINGLWPKMNGQNVCLFKIDASHRHSLYAIPSMVNGKDCDIIVMTSENYPDGKILGTRQEDGFIIQKGYDEIKTGDKISFYYEGRYFGENKNEDVINWHMSDEFTVEGELKLDWSHTKEDKTYYCLLLTDFQNNKHYTDMLLV